MKNILFAFPDGSTKSFNQGVTGLEIAQSISGGLAKEALAVEVNGEVWDLGRSISTDATIKILKWADDGGKSASWHSSAHLMAEAIESLFPGTKFGIGPPIEAGFYYDIDLGEHALTGEDLQKIEDLMTKLAERNAPYRREEKKWEEAVEYFKKKKDPYKLELLEELKGETITFYHQGNFTDLCYGPHIHATGRVKENNLLRVE